METRLACVAVALAVVAACDCGRAHERGDAGPAVDAGADAGTVVDASIDAAPTPDAAFDAGPPCTGDGSSTLPGVRIEFDPQPCVFTLDQAAAGIDVDYAVVVDDPLTDVTARPLDAGGCGTPGDSGLIPFEVLAGDGQQYCRCDVGLCPGTSVTGDLVPGTYPSTFHWTGHNWMGPSDTGMPMGEPFPPGTYTLTVTARGTYGGEDYVVEGTFPITLVP